MKTVLIVLLSFVTFGCAARKSSVAVSWNLTFNGQHVGCGESAGHIEAVRVYSTDSAGERHELAEFPCYRSAGTFELEYGTYELSVAALECADVLGLPACASDGETRLGRVLIASSRENLGHIDIELRDVE